LRRAADWTSQPRAAPNSAMTDDEIRAVFAAKGAERLRRKAIDLAHDYTRHARTLHLDPEIARHDVAAIVNAWQQVTP
jgi:hypothetical protein